MRTHDTDSEACWCGPDVLQRCPECEEHKDPPPTCWRCNGKGLVPEYDEGRPSVIVHQEGQEKPKCNHVFTVYQCDKCGVGQHEKGQGG